MWRSKSLTNTDTNTDTSTAIKNSNISLARRDWQEEQLAKKMSSTQSEHIYIQTKKQIEIKVEIKVIWILLDEQCSFEVPSKAQTFHSLVSCCIDLQKKCSNQFEIVSIPSKTSLIRGDCNMLECDFIQVSIKRGKRKRGHERGSNYSDEWPFDCGPIFADELSRLNGLISINVFKPTNSDKN